MKSARSASSTDTPYVVVNLKLEKKPVKKHAKYVKKINRI